jgi:hypothetical protein
LNVGIGIRHLWDFANDMLAGRDLGPAYYGYPSHGIQNTEASFSGAGLPTVYEMFANDGFSPYRAFGSGTGLVAFPSLERGQAVTVPPTRLDLVCAPAAAAVPFDYPVDPQITVTTEDTDCDPSPTGESGTAYYWTEEDDSAARGGKGIVLVPQESYTVDSWLWTDGFPPPLPPILCLSLEFDATQVAASALGIAGLQNNDVVCSHDAIDPIVEAAARGDEQGTFGMFFDGSDVGITRTIIDAMDIQEDVLRNGTGADRGTDEPMDVLLSFNIAHSIPPLGLVLQSDIVRFVAAENGSQTDGTFERFFDGSDIGLLAPGENIDALVFQEHPSVSADRGPVAGLGDLFFSTSGNLNVPGLQARDEDIVVCWGYDYVLLPTGDIESSCEEIELYFDGSAAGLAAESEDVDAFAFGPGRRTEAGRGLTFRGGLYLSTRGNFALEGVQGRNEDVFHCFPVNQPAERGIGPPLPINSCNSTAIVFDGSEYSLGSNNVYSIDLLDPCKEVVALRGGICDEQ